MPPIKLKKIVSVSSEDSNHQAENLLDYGFRTKWKCKSASDKEVSVVLQLEKPSKILSVDICNENSAFIEILVGRSDDPDDFEVLLKKSSLMSAEDAKIGKGVNDNKYFTSDALCTKIRDQRWDLVKLVCSQPYVNTHGTLISTWHILSNCLSFGKVMGNWRQSLDAYDFKVVAGIVSLEQSKQENAQVRDISAISLHPECKKTLYVSVYDFAIVLLRSPIKITEFVAPASLDFYVEGTTKFSSPKGSSCFMLAAYSNKTISVGKEDVQIQDCSSDSLMKNALFDCNECFFCTTKSTSFDCTNKLSGAPIFCSDQFIGIFNWNHICDKLYFFGTIETSMHWITYILTLGKTCHAVPSVFVTILTTSLLMILR